MSYGDSVMVVNRVRDAQGQPAANVFRKHMKSKVFRIGAAVEWSPFA